ncbi:MAG: hypothetical protein ACR2QB_07945 [Gammaproteobacteria bacterium]
MGSAGSRLDIAQAVRAILEQRSAAKRGLAIPTAGPVSNLAGIALLSLAPAAVTAVGLGEIQSQSSLGEPLRASVPISLASGESVRPGCITVPPKRQSDFRQPASARVNTPQASGPGVLQLGLSTVQPLYEPMYELTLRVDCPGIPTVLRHYVLMLDLPGMGAASQVATQNDPARAPLTVPGTAVSRTALPPQQSAPTRSRSLASSGAGIAAGSQYRVREGDTLSTIAARIEGRPADSTWALADWIFTANPKAFIRNNPNLIKLGTTITLPAAADWNSAGTGSSNSLTATAAEPAGPAPRPAPVQTAPVLVTPRPTESQLTEAASPVTTVMPTELVTTPSVAADSQAGEMTVATTPASPFADELPTSPAIEASEATQVSQNVEPPPVTVTQIQTPQAQSTQVSPVLAVLLGVLAGFGLSLLLLRVRLLEGLTSLFVRSRAKLSHSPADATYADADDWLKTGVAIPQPDPVSVGTPAEETYVVEVNQKSQLNVAEEPDAAAIAEEFDAKPIAEESEPAEVAEIDEHSLDDLDPLGQTSSFAAPLDSTSDSADSPEQEPELAELFADNMAAVQVETDLPEEIFAEEDNLEASSLAPTAEMPKVGETGAVIDDPTAESPTAELDSLSAELDETADMNLQGLSDAQSEDPKLSDTLQEALSLLEKDFENELTASQIIDQAAIKRALENDDDAEELDPAPQKRAG